MHAPEFDVRAAQAAAAQQLVDEILHLGSQQAWYVGRKAHAKTVISEVEGHVVEALVVAVGGQVPPGPGWKGRQRGR